ncbi:hypothetical protein [Natrinema sp. DC36]|uniref:hypothetical protein n=1 Tax=Natrinema sp. DC36 TaxID=2878680 RepID=UPI001CEFE166|nr:hypothetical protein [Natrinema sp. DC36]
MSLHRQPATARQRLVESSGTPFVPSADVRPVVGVIDGRNRNDEIEPTAWRLALEAAAVAVYFATSTDHEWWLAYDRDGEYDGYDGPYHLWSTYPSGSWDHVANTRGMMDANLENVYGEDDRELECQIHRSRVVCLEDAPEFVRREIDGE